MLLVYVEQHLWSYLRASLTWKEDVRGSGGSGAFYDRGVRSDKKYVFDSILLSQILSNEFWHI